MPGGNSFIQNLLSSPQEVETRKEVAPKAEEEGAESSSSEANGPVVAAAPTSSNIADQEGGTSEDGRRTIRYFIHI